MHTTQTLGGSPGDGNTTQLFICDPEFKVRTNLKCSGQVPTPHRGHAATALYHKAWVYGGENKVHGAWKIYNELYELDMCSLTWTKISVPNLTARLCCTLTATRKGHLVLHGGALLG